MVITSEPCPSVYQVFTSQNPRNCTLQTKIAIMKVTTITAAVGMLAHANAGLLRFGCAQLTVQRLDPLVNPGANPSPHIHQIIGGVRPS
jgi:hypothetical protein